MQRLADRPELLDGPLDDLDALRANLRDLRRVNRWLGGTALSRSALVALATGFHRDPRVGHLDWRARPITLLDVGTGSGDIPVALAAWGAGRGMQLEIEAIDERHEIIDIAREVTADEPAVRLDAVGGPPLPYPDDGFDIAHMSLVAHHLEPDDLAALLAEMRRVSRIGVIVNDLERGRLPWLGAWLLGRVATRNRLTRHDAPLSVRRAYTASELAQIAARVGLLEVSRARGYLGHRYAIAFVPVELPAADADAAVAADESPGERPGTPRAADAAVRADIGAARAATG
jgi:ubiquinone/menaquinone biosynthesis C-methylase UbiE